MSPSLTLARYTKYVEKEFELGNNALTQLIEYFDKENIHVYGINHSDRMNKAEKGFRPQDYLPDPKSIICFGIPVPENIYSLTSYRREFVWRTQNLLYRKLDTHSVMIVNILENIGKKAVPIFGCLPQTYNSKKELAGYVNQIQMGRITGIGFIGKNGLLLNSLYGSRMMLEGMEFVFTPLETKYQMVSPTYPPVTTMGELTDGIVRILETEGIDRINILGQSFGGILARVIAHTHPDKANKLILPHTTTTSPPCDKTIMIEKLKRIEKKEKVLSFLPFGIFLLLTKWKISKLTLTNIEEKEFWDAYFHEMLSNIKKEAWASLSKCMIDFGQNYTFSRDDLANWPGKILILESDNDPFFHLSERKALRELYPQAQVHTFRGTGHLTIIVNREEFISVVRSFLQEK